MADGKREHEYDLMIAVACYIRDVFGDGFKPGSANPIRNEITNDLIESNDPRGTEGFAMLGAALGMMAQSQGA
jgi:hypothetical protein